MIILSSVIGFSYSVDDVFIGIIYEGVDKLQWSVVYNLTDRTGSYGDMVNE